MTSSLINNLPPVTLPIPPEDYDIDDQRQMRRTIEQALNKTAASTSKSIASSVQAIPQGTVTIDVNGAWEFAVDVPPNANSARWDSSTSGFPADATVAAGGGSIILVTGGQLFTGTSASGSSTGVISFGQTVFITLIPFTGASGTGATLPGVHIRGSFLQTTATKFDTYVSASLVVANAYATAVVADTAASGKLTYVSGNPTHAQAFATLKVANSVKITSVSIYVVLNFTGAGGITRNAMSFDAITKSTQAFTNVGQCETDSASSSVQLVTTSGLSHTVDSNNNTYLASSLQVVSGGPTLVLCNQWNFTVGYTQNNANQGL